MEANGPDDFTVRDNTAELRYEIIADGELKGVIRYRVEPGIVVLVHTEVDEDAEGKGVASRLVKGAIDDIRARGLGLVPQCPFVAEYLRRHPEYADLVVSDPATPE